MLCKILQWVLTPTIFFNYWSNKIRIYRPLLISQNCSKKLLKRTSNALVKVIFQTWRNSWVWSKNRLNQSPSINVLSKCRCHRQESLCLSRFRLTKIKILKRDMELLGKVPYHPVPSTTIKKTVIKAALVLRWGSLNFFHLVEEVQWASSQD